MLTTKEISNIVGGQLDGKPDIEIFNINKIENSKPGSISFIANDKYLKYLEDSKASAIIVNKNSKIKPNGQNRAFIKVEDVYLAVSKLLKLLEKDKIENNGLSDLSFIALDAQIGEGVSIGAFTYISENVKIGKNTSISTQVFIGKNVEIGENTIIMPGVKIYTGCKIGNNCIIHANAVIGSDGFGFKPNKKGEYEKIPQVGIVVVEDHVEIGANTVIDRATFDETRIHKGVKLDNLIQIAHNVEIGENTVIAALTGIAGSAKLGKNIVCGGQVGISTHMTIADGSKFQAQSGVIQNIKKKNGSYMGSPAIDYYNHMKSSVIFKRLPELQNRITELEKQIEKLTKTINNE